MWTFKAGEAARFFVRLLFSRRLMRLRLSLLPQVVYELKDDDIYRTLKWRHIQHPVDVVITDSPLPSSLLGIDNLSPPRILSIHHLVCCRKFRMGENDLLD